MPANETVAAQTAILRAAMVADNDCECCGGHGPEVTLSRRHGKGRKRALCGECR